MHRLKLATGTTKRLLYMRRVCRTFKDRENREVAMLLYDHLGLGICKCGGSFYVLVIYRRGEQVGALNTYATNAATDEMFRNQGWERLWRSQDYWGCDLGVPQFSSPRELKMKFELKGLENHRK